MLAVLAALALGDRPVAAEIWNRTRGDGVVEFTDRPPVRAATKEPQVTAEAVASRARWERNAREAPDGGGTFWARERADGVVEFTNLKPAGRNWRVWFKTGPGKAAALRGKTDVVPPRDRSPVRYSRYDDHIRDQQVFYGIPEALVRAVIKVESDYDPNVVSSVGAQGLMQLMPATARLMGVTDPFDPRQNIMGGSRYLQILARRFCKTPAHVARPDRAAGPGLVCSDDEQVKVIAGYHAGPGAVEKYGGLPPYETTRAYVAMVLRRFEEFRRAPGARTAAFVAER